MTEIVLDKIGTAIVMLLYGALGLILAFFVAALAAEGEYKGLAGLLACIAFVVALGHRYRIIALLPDWLVKAGMEIKSFYETARKWPGLSVVVLVYVIPGTVMAGLMSIMAS